MTSGLFHNSQHRVKILQNSIQPFAHRCFHRKIALARYTEKFRKITDGITFVIPIFLEFVNVKFRKDCGVKCIFSIYNGFGFSSNKLECVILDKNVTVSDGAELKGTPEHPVIIKKGETV